MQIESYSVKASIGDRESVSQLLILPDGRVLVHDLTQSCAELLATLDPDCEHITSRITHHASRNHELPN